eukprot:gnl/MRDRNA2_/MRDRNA2_175811_c0_seq1.p1 gnl/MRDRNA2_/MRDRNA2_175811_c0~~gnl/MRDRNA2_/MRDRNA2_175811_c0_seq1.p1  ORF type:complete len:100 (-),score=6.29 gnl/MRDRNA2_/MRDRNA2_175811_c0_seq1:173-472(-)
MAHIQKHPCRVTKLLPFEIMRMLLRGPRQCPKKSRICMAPGHECPSAVGEVLRFKSAQSLFYFTCQFCTELHISVIYRCKCSRCVCKVLGLALAQNLLR